MTSHHTRKPRRRALALVLITLTTALTGVAATGAQAGPPSPTPVTITVVDVESSVVTPDTAGAPEDLLVAGEPFAVDVSFSAPISEVKPVTLEITSDGPAFTSTSVTRIEVPKGAITGSFAALALDTAANDVRLTVRATAPAKIVESVVPGSSAPLDVSRDAASYAIDGPNGASVSREGVGVACTATPERPTCVDLVLPAAAGNGTQALFSTQVCRDSDGCLPGSDVLQVLAAFTLPEQTPATLIVKCDKSLCGGGAITSVPFQVSLSATGALETPPACSSKGVVDEGLDSCIDYVQSKRDGSGDTHLYWLVTRDARMSWG